MASKNSGTGCGLLILIACALAGLQAGGGAAVVAVLGVIIVIVISVAVSSSNKKEQKTATRSQPRAKVASASSNKTMKAKAPIWLPSGQTITHPKTGLLLPGPLYYSKAPINEDRYGVAEPSAIILSLSVSSEPSYLDFGYWPSYSSIDSDQRRTYLEWIASGRKSVPPHLGYIFVFFYGLERRLIIDESKERELFDLSYELFQKFRHTFQSRSFNKYLSQFLHISAWQLGEDSYAILLNRLLEDEKVYIRDHSLNLALSYYCDRQAPLPPKLAIHAIQALPDTKRSVVFKRANQEFLQLFTSKYKALPNGGFIPKSSKRKLSFHYEKATAAYLPSNKCSSFSIQNVLGLPSQFRPLTQIWDECIEELSAFSRAVGKQANEMEKFMVLPQELRKNTKHPKSSHFSQLKELARREGDVLFISTSQLAGMLEIQERKSLTRTQSKQLEQLYESFGYRVLPILDALGGTLKWEEELALIPFGAIENPKLLFGTLRLLSLVSAVAAADEQIDDVEFETFNSLANVESLPETDRNIVKGTELFLRLNPSFASSAITRICKQIKGESSKAQHVGKIVSEVAAADGVVTPEEKTMLNRIYKALGLSNDPLDSIPEEVTVLTRKLGKKGEAIPAPASIPEKKPALSLDMDKIKDIARETQEVTTILADIFVDDAEDEDEDANATIPGEELETAAGFPNLEDRFQSPAEKLFAKEEWSLEEFDDLAKSHHLLPDALYDNLNAWSDEELGDFILERDDKIRVFTELLQQTNA